jgi:hypothetical protein
MYAVHVLSLWLVVLIIHEIVMEYTVHARAYACNASASVGRVKIHFSIL